MSFLLNTNSSRFGEEGGFQNIGEVFSNGGKVFLLGLLTVFAVLALIWGCLEIFHLFCYTLPHKRKSAKQPTVLPDVHVAPAIPVPVDVPAETVDATVADEEVVAVIAAAIEAAKADTPNGLFRVVSFRKK